MSRLEKRGARGRLLMGALFLAAALAGCATGSTLRSAAVLDRGEVEISAGIATAVPVVIAAYGVTNHLELEARYECDYVSLTPRLQVVSSKKFPLNGTVFFEVGHGFNKRFQLGPGVILGRKWKSIEPYISYRFRHNIFWSSKEEREDVLFNHTVHARNIHYVCVGMRYYPSFFKSKTERGIRRWFLDFEIEPLFVDHSVAVGAGLSVGSSF